METLLFRRIKSNTDQYSTINAVSKIWIVLNQYEPPSEDDRFGSKGFVMLCCVLLVPNVVYTYC